MKLIPLTQNQFAKVDDDDYDELIKYKWYAAWAPNTKSFYAVRGGRISDGDMRGKKIRMHRQIKNYPCEMEIDHIDHDTINNQRSNLRICTHSENMRNRSHMINNKTGYKGVTKNTSGSKWSARIRIDSKGIHLGSFDTPLQAYSAYLDAARDLHGEFFFKSIT